MTGTYLILEQTEKTSKYGGIVYQLTMVRLEDRKEFKTYIDPQNYNWRNWQYIVSNSHKGFIIDHVKIIRKNLITADSKPKIVYQHDDKQWVFDQIVGIWQQI